MLILQVMNRDHRYAKSLLAHIKDNEETLMESNIQILLSLLQEFKNEVLESQLAEQDIVYKAINTIINNNDKNIKIAHLLEEHALVNRVMSESLDNFENNNLVKGFAQFYVIEDLLSQHFQYEESYLYTMLNNNFNSHELDTIGEAYELKRLQASPIININ